MPIAYVVGASATFGILGTDTLAGTFTIDPTSVSELLVAVDIVVTGPIEPDTYDTVFPTKTSLNDVESTNAALTKVLSIEFLDLLGTTADDISRVVIDDRSTGAIFGSSSVTGSAAPAVPEPTTLALLGGALCLFFLQAQGKSALCRGPTEGNPIFRYFTAAPRRRTRWI
jgi:hypothetical protein